MINKYQNGKIYKLYNIINDKHYIGSTICTLDYRKRKHKSASKIKSKQGSPLYKEVKKIGWLDEIGTKEIWKIELIENYSCKNGKQLRRREGFYQILGFKYDKKNILNREIAGRTLAEHYRDNKKRISKQRANFKLKNPEKILIRLEKGKKYRNDNIEKCKLRQKKWRDKNKDKTKLRQKKWRESNREKYLEYHRERSQTEKEKLRKKKWKEDNRDKMKEKKECKICGYSVRRDSFTRHLKTKRHISNMKK